MITGWSTARQARPLIPRQIRIFSEKGELSYWWRMISGIRQGSCITTGDARASPDQRQFGLAAKGQISQRPPGGEWYDEIADRLTRWIADTAEVQGDRLVIMAGVPFGTAGSTNVIHVVRLIGDELERYAPKKDSAGE